MPMAPFFTRCPKLAETEFRTATVIGDPHIPPGEYGFLELYCDEPDCDCRRVLIHVITPTMETGKPLATINYGWESEEFYRKWMHSLGDDDLIREMVGPSLEPLAPQCNLAPHFLELFQSMVQDPAFVDRLHKHYRLFRKEIEAEHNRPTMRNSSAKTRSAPNSPCPCGSGKKHKKCCGRMG